MSAKQILQLLDECRAAHGEVDRITAAGHVSQFAVDQASEADARLVDAIEELFDAKLSEVRKAVESLKRRVDRMAQYLYEQKQGSNHV